MLPAELTVAVLRFALDSILAALTVDPTRDVEDLKNERQAATAMLAALKPMDAVQAALAARAVTAHHTSMECFRRAALGDVPSALMTRLFASGMALSRMSTQLIKALEQRKAMTRPGAAVDPIGAILAATPPVAGQQRPGTAAPNAAAGTQHPMSSEKQPAAGTPRTAAAQNPVQQPVAGARIAGEKHHAKTTTPWTGGPIMTREEIAAMAGLPVSMIPAA